MHFSDTTYRLRTGALCLADVYYCYFPSLNRAIAPRSANWTQAYPDLSIDRYLNINKRRSHLCQSRPNPQGVFRHLIGKPHPRCTFFDYLSHPVANEWIRLTRLFVFVEVVPAGSHTPKQVAFHQFRPFLL